MRRGPDARPVTEFPLPADVPDSVASARDRFLELAEELTSARSELHKAEEAIESARKSDLDTLGQKMADGGNRPSNPHGNERKAREHHDELRDQVGALEAAVDHAGNNLAEAVAAARTDWLAALRDEVDEARARFRDAVEQAGQALDALAVPAETLPWLEGFAAWKLDPTQPQPVQRAAMFRRALPVEISEAFAGISALAAAVDAPEPAPAPPTRAERRKAAAEA